MTGYILDNFRMNKEKITILSISLFGARQSEVIQSYTAL